MITSASSHFIRILNGQTMLSFSERITYLMCILQSLNLVVYGMSYDRQEITEAMYDQLRPMRRLKDGRPLPEGCRHILLAHGGDSRHIPINQEKLRQAGFDYMALGHIHKPWIDDRSPMAYAGALEPIDRNDEGHPWLYSRCSQ